VVRRHGPRPLPRGQKPRARRPSSAYDPAVSATPPRVRIVVADDHPLFREAIVRAVRERPEFELVAEAADGREALEAIREHRPDVAILDVKMPELDGLRVLNAVRRDDLGARVVLLSAFLDGHTAYEAVAGGAAAFLSKDADRRRITDTVAAVARGETVLGPEVQAGLAEEIRLRGTRDRPALSEREREVLGHIAAGRSAPEIAKLLFLSPATIKSHLQGLYEKLGVSDRAAAVAEAMRRGLIE
jgi:two-component system, NarL family, nitrate/nitrite response regulator NarL